MSKKNVVVAALGMAVALLCVGMPAQARKKEAVKPIGTFVMKQAGPKGKDLQPTRLEQYKICDGEHTLGLYVMGDLCRMDVDQVTFVLRNEKQIVASAKKGKATPDQVYVHQVSEDAFHLDWCMAQSPDQVTEEAWERGQLSCTAQKVADIMLHGNQARTGSRFNGLWKCYFAEAERNSEDANGNRYTLLRQSVGYKYVMDDYSIVFFGVNPDRMYDEDFRCEGFVRTMRVLNNNHTREAGTDCLISWRDENHFRLVYVDPIAGMKTEEWERVR